MFEIWFWYFERWHEPGRWSFVRMLSVTERLQQYRWQIILADIDANGQNDDGRDEINVNQIDDVPHCTVRWCFHCWFGLNFRFDGQRKSVGNHTTITATDLIMRKKGDKQKHN